MEFVNEAESLLELLRVPTGLERGMLLLRRDWLSIQKQKLHRLHQVSHDISFMNKQQPLCLDPKLVGIKNPLYPFHSLQVQVIYILWEVVAFLGKLPFMSS